MDLHDAMVAAAAPAAAIAEVPETETPAPRFPLTEVDVTPDARAVLEKAGAMVIAPAIAKVEVVHIVDKVVLEQLGVGVGSSTTFHDAETRDEKVAWMQAYANAIYMADPVGYKYIPVHSSIDVPEERHKARVFAIVRWMLRSICGSTSAV